MFARKLAVLLFAAAVLGIAPTNPTSPAGKVVVRLEPNGGFAWSRMTALPNENRPLAARYG